MLGPSESIQDLVGSPRTHAANLVELGKAREALAKELDRGRFAREARAGKVCNVHGLEEAGENMEKLN